MVLTNDSALHESLRMLRSHGTTRDPERMDKIPDGAWYYQQTDLGYNYRMTDFQAALGASQMTRLDDFIETRKSIAERYCIAFRDLALILPTQRTGAVSAWHLYVVLVDTKATQRSRKEVFDALRAAGILVNVHYVPVHLQPYYRRMGFNAGDFPEAERYYERTISLPMHTRLLDADFDHVISTMARVLG